MNIDKIYVIWSQPLSGSMHSEHSFTVEFYSGDKHIRAIMTTINIFMIATELGGNLIFVNNIIFEYMSLGIGAPGMETLRRLVQERKIIIEQH